MVVKAVAFDLIGTLVHIKPRQELMLRSLKEKLIEDGVAIDGFNEEYIKVEELTRSVRQEKLREVNSCTVVAQVLKRVGHRDLKHDALCYWVDAYFRPYIDSVVTVEGTREVLEEVGEDYSLGIVSNFPCSAAVKGSLKKTGLYDLFDHIIVSCEVGWRKPHPRIFNSYLRRARVKASESVFVGDDPRRDIGGARNAGMRTILLAAGITPTEDYYYPEEAEVNFIKPDMEVRSLTELPRALKGI
ncbi:MAG: HAD family hydrolase [Candidatus Bathyarchaeia archaeon]